MRQVNDNVGNKWRPLQILCLHSLLIVVLAYSHSVSFDETGHLAAGLVHWKHSDFSMYAVNPPLVRLIALSPTIPLVSDYEVPEYSAFVEHRAELPVGVHFATSHPQYLHCVFIARLACIPFSLLGAMLCFHWTKSLYGYKSGIAAMLLWCFSPTIQSNASQVLPDLAATSLILASCYLLRSWYDSIQTPRPLQLGCVIGAALLTKFTAVILIPIAIFTIFAATFVRLGRPSISTIGILIRQFSILFATILVVINVGYFFEETCVPLREFEFVSETLSGNSRIENVKGNRFKASCFSKFPVPIPRNYVLGIDLAKYEFERGYWCYLNGEFQNKGWWYFYLYALLMKEPFGFWCLFVIAIAGVSVRFVRRRLSFEEWMLIGTSVLVLTTVSSQTGYTHHLRYILPVLPIWYILSSAISANSRLASIQFVFLAAFVASSCLNFPHQISYFNEIAGGTANGWKHLNSSNYDWGQNLIFLKNWIDLNPGKQPLFVQTSGAIPPSVYGINSQPANAGFSSDGEVSFPSGWYAICVGEMLKVDSPVRPFLKLEPVERVAHTVFIYHLAEPYVVREKNSKREEAQ